MTASLRPSPSRRALALALLAATAACGGGSSSDGGGPLATLAGELRAAPGGAAQGALRLALAWYPGLMTDDGQPLSQPGAIATQDVAYSGALPQAYAFAVEEVPPAAALRPMPEGWTGRGAVGVLLAYQDGNGNGALDPIPAGGAPVDRVVGASLDWSASPAFLVVYLTDDQPAGTGLEAGFNLLRITDPETTEVVARSTPIPLAISGGGALLDLFVCEAAWDGSGAELPCGLELDPGEQVLDAYVDGEIYADADGAEAGFGLYRIAGSQAIPLVDATVTLDGIDVPYDADRGHYHAALDAARFAEPRTVELVARSGDAVLRREIEIPAFDLTDVPAVVTSGTAFDVAWSAPASARVFDLYLVAGQQPLLAAYGLTGPGYHVAPIDHVGEARLTVAALAADEITVTVVRTTTLTFAPPQAAVESRR